ncbi:MFS transporter [Eggerthella guodeyinii]|uniref:MFS transporter n=1 Tax=Eggerthella guodeyinii TaxID=2690837 RepID=A0A6N7RPE6_9ACTN|nr:MFS transporter [Eggerthella guodeyinii]MRX82922.1 MFS transporter [Eggerthella guodeyinii]
MTQQKGKIFYGYAIMVSCIIMLIVGTGIIVNTVNQFVLPITEQTGMSRAAFTLYTSFQNIALMLTVPFLSKIYAKIKPKVITIIGFLIMCAAYCLLSQCTQAWQFYVCGVFIGFGLAFVSTTTVGVLINNWFIKNKGTVMGIAMAGSGFGSMIFNPVAQQLIGNMGYQTAYLCLGAIMFVCFIPALALYVFKPEDKGLVPLGYEEKQAEQAAQAAADGGSGEKKEVVREGYTYKEAIRSPKFYILAFVIICLSGMSMGTFQQLSAYLVGTGYEKVFAASVVSAVSLFLMFGKFIWGFLRDRIGMKATFVIALSIFVVQYILLLFVGTNPALCYVHAVLFGLSFATPTMFAALLVNAAFGEKEYTRIYSTMQFFFYFGPIICNPLTGAIFDMTGAYTMAFIIYAVCIFICLIVGLVLLRGKGKKAAA